MEGQSTHEQQAKDYMAFFPQDLAQVDQLQSTAEQFPFHPNPLALNANIQLLGNAIENLVNEQQQPSSYNPAMLLEHQAKLSQLLHLQHLQQQILQQQFAIISGAQTSALPVERESREQVVPFHGLPTPGNSAELRATPSVEYVSPIILDYDDTFSQPYIAPRGASSAPAHIAFHQATQQSDLDFDVSPLTSPWLGAHQQPVRTQPATGQSRPSTKRTAASSSDEEAGERPSHKKRSPAIRATVLIPKKSSRSKSANSTPLLRSTRSRKGSISVPGDTPSPIDLSMPPPAPPADSAGNLASTSPGLETQLTPITPASIMNLGRLNKFANVKPSKKSPATTSATSGLKAILPGAASAPSRQMNPPVQVRKTSHKAAEQKRRDSLKTTFDDLRTLLPPIPLPSEAADEPVLPGALPPRGPPKAGAEGPNKAVSKLQLLIYGNDYIRQLHGRVQRRDDEIGRLRSEVAHLRGVVRGEIPLEQRMEEVDLECDLDAVEYGHMFGRQMTQAMSEVDEEGEEEGEE